MGVRLLMALRLPMVLEVEDHTAVVAAVLTGDIAND
jgi:hypothetical protein